MNKKFIELTCIWPVEIYDKDIEKATSSITEKNLFNTDIILHVAKCGDNARIVYQSGYDPSDSVLVTESYEEVKALLMGCA